MRRAAAVLVLALLLAVAHPLESLLRAQAPPRAASADLGTGRLLGSVLTGAFRPLLLTYLWIRADVLFGQGRLDERLQVWRTMIQLYPDNRRAREYLGWDLSFNMKSEAPNRDFGWKFSEEGLDVLLDLGTADGRIMVVEWIRKQCGQNAVYEQRYAGPAWEQEKWWRLRLRAWGRRRLGADLGRFELAHRLLEGHDDFLDRLRRSHLEEMLAYEELLRNGEAAHGARAVATLEAVARETADLPGLSELYRDAADRLATLLAGTIPGSVPVEAAYRPAMALWGMGAHRRDATMLQAALALLEASGERTYLEERAGIAAWLHHLENGGPRPPLPLDGIQ